MAKGKPLEAQLIQGLHSNPDNYYFLLARVLLARHLEEKVNRKGRVKASKTSTFGSRRFSRDYEKRRKGRRLNG